MKQLTYVGVIMAVTAVAVRSQNSETRHSPRQFSSPVFSKSGFSFHTARYSFRADTHQAKGLYRGITIIYRSSVPMGQVQKTLVHAKFARQDSKTSKRWIVGKAIEDTYDKDGHLVAECICERIQINII